MAKTVRVNAVVIREDYDELKIKIIKSKKYKSFSEWVRVKMKEELTKANCE